MGMVRQAIPIAKKVEVIDYIEKNCDCVASRAAAHFVAQGWKIDERVCRRLWSNRDTIRRAASAAYRLPGAGRKPVMGGLENEIVDMITEMRLQKEKVTRQWIVDAALRIGFMNEIELGGSQHWVTNFMRRNNLTLRRVTNLTTLADDEVIRRAVSYLQYLKSIQDNMCGERTILMDETAVYFDDPRMVTVDNVGARHVVMKSTGFQSMRITAVLAVTASGRKVQPLLIWKGRSEDIVSVNGCWVAQQPRAWVDQTLLIKWLDRAFPMLWIGNSMHVVWDSMRAHIGKAVKAHCAARGIDMCVIPGGMTPYLQAGDIGIYKSFKDNMSILIDAWKNSGTVQYTSKGNPRPPSVEVVSDWVRQAWRLVPAEVVNRSIARAGLVDEYTEWQIARHDVYGERFVTEWLTRADNLVTEFAIDESYLCDALDDITLIEQ